MRSNVKSFVLFIVLLMTFSASGLAAGRRVCTSEQLAEISDYARVVRNLVAGEVLPSEVPRMSQVLRRCDPGGKLQEPLGRPLARMIFEARKDQDADRLKFLRLVLEHVRKGYEDAEHPGDFLKLAIEIYSEIGRLQDEANLSEWWWPDPPRPTTAGAERVKALDGMVAYLEELSKGFSTTPPATVRPSSSQPSTTTSQLSTTTTQRVSTTEKSTTTSVRPPPGPGPSLDPFLVLLGFLTFIALIGTAIFFYKRPKSPDSQPQRQGSSNVGRSEVGRHTSSHRPRSEVSSSPRLTLSEDVPLSPSSQIVSEVVTPVDGPGQQGDYPKLQERMDSLVTAFQGLREERGRFDESLGELADNLKDIEGKLGGYDYSKWGVTSHQVKNLQGRVEELGGQVKNLESQLGGLLATVEASHRDLKSLSLRLQPRSSLGALLETEQNLLRREWRRFVENRATREIGELVEHIDDDEGYQVLLGLLNELPSAFESDRGKSQAVESKLNPVLIYVQQVKQLGLAKRRTEEDLPKEPDQQEQRLLLIRDSAYLLAILKSTEAGGRVLRFKATKWCAEEFLEIADLFLQTYQKAQLEGRESQLEEARASVYKALRLGKLQPIEIVLEQTPFDSTIHVGKAYRSDASLNNGTIVGVIKNGFCSLRDGSVVIQPEVEVNRY